MVLQRFVDYSENVSGKNTDGGLWGILCCITLWNNVNRLKKKKINFHQH